MIYIAVNGRLGNQLFHYAFSRQLQKHNPNETIVYNYDNVYRAHRPGNDGYENSLVYFHTKRTDRQESLNYSIPQYIVWKIFRRFYPSGALFSVRDRYERRWCKVLEFFGLYILNLGYRPFRLRKPWWVKNLIVSGSWESAKFFEGCEEELREEIKPVAPLQDYNQPLMEAIQNSNSVAISIRRGDFVDIKSVKNLYFVCDENYYMKAIERIKQRVKNPTFIFFSNDIEWVKQNIHIDGCPCYYESGRDEVWETLRLMSSCKHFIISNSTLHWWAQYLCTNPDKVVIAPNRWYNDEFKSALFQDNWETIDN